MTRDTFERRTVLKTMAVGAATATIAGCSSNEGSGGDDSGGDDSGSDDSGRDGSAEFDGWFDDVGNYDGVVDETGSSEVTVTVGAQGNGGGFAFSPAAVRIDAGTTVVWEWTGDGGSHNVVAEDGSFESEQTDEAGHAFEHEFGDSGTYKYACVPHKAMGMKGAVVVE
jgi:halocyanin-like protein